MNVVWSKEDREFIKNNANVLTDLEISEALTKKTGREVTLYAARKQRQKMGIAKCNGRGVCKIKIRNIS